MNTSAAEFQETTACSIRARLLKHGLCGALEYFCTFHVFSID